MEILAHEMTDNPSDLLAASNDRMKLHEFALGWLTDRGMAYDKARPLAATLFDEREVMVGEFQALRILDVRVLDDD